MSIVIVGAYGFENVGDEAMLYVVLRSLQSVLPNETRVVSCVDQDAVNKLHNVDTVPGVSPLSIIKSFIQFRLGDFQQQLKTFSQMKLLVYGGGSLFTDSKGLKNISMILMTVMGARFMKVPVIIWGVSVGPVTTRLGRHVVKAILKLATLVIVRDKQSAVVANELSYGELDIRKGADLLFNSLRWSDIDRHNSWKVKSPLQIGISLRPYPSTRGTDYIAKDQILVSGSVKAFRSLNDRRSIELTPLVFSRGAGRRDDLGILNKVKKKLSSELFIPNSGGISEEGDDKVELIINKMLMTISELDVVIGERFHSLVTAALMGIPFIAISYDQKVRELAVMSGMGDYCIDFQDDIDEIGLAEAIVSKIELLLENYSQIRVMLSENIIKIEKVAEQDRLYILDKLKTMCLN